MNRTHFGNLDKENLQHPNRNGWFVGQFIDSTSPLHSKDLEIKWGLHKAGELFEKVRMNAGGKSIAILVDGEFKFTFPDAKEVYYLKNKGDFVFWDSGVYHHTKCLKDATIITIRWPSIPDDVHIKEITT